MLPILPSTIISFWPATQAGRKPVESLSVATTGITLIAPYTGDPTWDYVDALFMSVLAFTTAPWTVGALYRVVQRKLPAQQGFVAFCVWMFSAS